MKLTREQAIKEHRKMWNWLAEHPEKDKADYLALNDFKNIYSECFLCAYGHQQNDDYCYNKDCLCDWGEADGCMGSMFNLGLYKVYKELTSLLRDINKNSEWSKDITKGLRLMISRTAKTIAELPENEEGSK